MSKPSTFEKLSDILTEQLGVEFSEIDQDSRIVADLGADSLDVVAIISAIEREWNLEIDDTSAESIATVGEVIAFIDYLCL